MALLPLKPHGFAIVDDEDLPELSKNLWYLHNQGYAYCAYVRGSGRSAKRGVLLHRLVLNAPKGVEVDHIAGDKLDNRKAMLRLCSRSGNMRNRRKTTSVAGRPTSSRFKGVYWDRKKSKWGAMIHAHRRGKFLRYFTDERAAAAAYNTAATKEFREFAKLNVV